MKLFKLGLIALTVFSMALTSCNNDDDDTQPNTQDLILNISGLSDLGNNFAYEGWIIVDGAPVSTGIFTVDADGNLSKSTFDIAATDLENASTFVLTIEPSPDSDPAPSDVHILAGDFSNSSADLTVGHGAALGNDFSTSTGKYILATPTDGAGDPANERSGVWFLDPGAGPGAGLDLPTLPAGWAYEGWAVVDGTPVSTGTFTALDAADDAAIYSGAEAGPPFPGEDLLNNAPAGLTFPIDLAGSTVVISIEPVPDNSAAPFLLKPLVGNVANDAVDHTVYELGNNSTNTNPTGSVSRQN